MELTEENTGAKQEQNIDENKLLEVLIGFFQFYHESYFF